MRILVVGGGGREHALCHALASSPQAPELLCAPGNAGIAALAECCPIPDTEVDGLLALVEARGVDLVVIGPEGPLVAGLADRLSARGVPVVGPSAAAAQLEGSKAFAKAFMHRHGIPTAAAHTFADVEAARAYVAHRPLPLVLKADGLAAGKGVLICETRAEVEAGLRAMLEDHAFGAAGAQVVIEDFLQGEEASVFALTDGAAYVLLAPAQDHKRVGEGDTGPNTGGMGTYAPAPVVTAAVMARVEAEIIQPTLRGMAAEGTPYQGILFVGLMIGPDGPKVVEYNARLGDPETQVVLPLLEADFVEVCLAMATGRVDTLRVSQRPGAAACVVLAAEGYPGPYPKGRPITGLDAVPPGVTVYHAGTQREGPQVITSGGRVLGVVGRGDDLADALGRAYAGVAAVQFDGMHYRRDIGQKGLRRNAASA